MCSLLVNLECHNCLEGAIFGDFGASLSWQVQYFVCSTVIFSAGAVSFDLGGRRNISCSTSTQALFGDVGEYSIGADSTTKGWWCKGFVDVCWHQMFSKNKADPESHLPPFWTDASQNDSVFTSDPSLRCVDVEGVVPSLLLSFFACLSSFLPACLSPACQPPSRLPSLLSCFLAWWLSSFLQWQSLLSQDCMKRTSKKGNDLIYSNMVARWPVSLQTSNTSA